MSASETKQKILNVATKLFAVNGFDGTSIRDIANEADVNVASIKYHFENKKGLYFELFKFNCDFLEEGIKTIYSDGEKSLTELCEEIFDFMIENHTMLMNSFKMMMNDELAENQECPMKDNPVGPPGGEIIMQAILKECPQEVDQEKVFWAARTLFTQMIHLALMSGTKWMKNQYEDLPFMRPENLKGNLPFLVEAVLNYLKR